MRRAAPLLALLVLLSAAVSEGLDCRELGFTGFSLCSSCDALESAVHDTVLAAECRQCCAADDSGDADSGPVDSAVLEVCPWRLSMHAELREFADDAAKLYGGTRFRVKNKSGAPPTLVLSSKGSATPQRVRVDAWKRSTLSDYLKSRLELPAAALAAGEL